MMRVLQFITILLVALVATAVAGGEHGHGEAGHGGDAGHEDEHARGGESPSVAVTLWTDGMELFMEYPVLVANEPGRFIIHLTILDDFQPVRVVRFSCPLGIGLEKLICDVGGDDEFVSSRTRKPGGPDERVLTDHGFPGPERTA